MLTYDIIHDVMKRKKTPKLTCKYPHTELESWREEWEIEQEHRKNACRNAQAILDERRLKGDPPPYAEKDPKKQW